MSPSTHAHPRQLDVCLSPELLNLYDLQGKIVVMVDILRASSCMVTALGEGVSRIHPVASLDECRRLQQQDYIAAAERGGQQIEGFDLGNSPLSYLNGAFSGKKVAMTTTNGTLAITKSAPYASRVVVGAFLNLSALAHWLQLQTEDVVILCAGWKGKVNMEDTLFAGALAHRLAKTHGHACDAPLAAQTLYEAVQNRLYEYLMKSSHAKRLGRFGVYEDIRFCLQEDKYDIIPILQGDELIALL
jgi:2-phosphosulfolactate phosphatase